MIVSAWADSCNTEGLAQSRGGCSSTWVSGNGVDTDVGESRAEGDDDKMAMGETTTAEASRNQPHGLSTISAAVSKLAFSFVGCVSKKTAAQRPASSRMRNNPQEALSAAVQ